MSYVLDASNKRAAKKINGVVQRKWLYAGGLLPMAEYDANDNLTAVFNGGYMVKNGTTYRLLRDHLGSVRLVVDAATGTVAQRLSYGPWGEVLEDTNPGFQPFGYAGGLYDPDTGLVRFGSRDYDPAVGRWVCKDPVGLRAGSNVYAYCGNESIGRVDSAGLQASSTGIDTPIIRENVVFILPVAERPRPIQFRRITANCKCESLEGLSLVGADFDKLSVEPRQGPPIIDPVTGQQLPPIYGLGGSRTTMQIPLRATGPILATEPWPTYTGDYRFAVFDLIATCKCYYEEECGNIIERPGVLNFNDALNFDPIPDDQV